MKFFYAISLFVVILMTLSPVLFLSANSGAGPDSVVTGYGQNGEAIKTTNPTVHYDVYSSGIRSIDPTTCGDVTSSSFQGEFYEGLYTYHYLLRDKGRPVVIPALAAEMPHVSDDRLTYTIKLKKGVKYHRNPCFGKKFATREVEAKDFVLAFKRIADPHNVRADLSWSLIRGKIRGLDEFRKICKTKYKNSPGDFSRYDLKVEGLTALDRYTLQLRLKRPFPQFQLVLAMHLYAPTPREAIDFWLATKSTSDDPMSFSRETIPQKKRSITFKAPEMVVGTGAYLLNTWRRRSKIILVRNPDFRQEYYPTVEEIRTLASDKIAVEEQIKKLRDIGLLKDAGKQIPFIDACVYEFVSESYPMWMLFLSKRTDASGIPSEAFEQVVTPGKELTDEWKKRGIFLRKYSKPVLYWIVFNMDDPLFKASDALRQAMCLCYNVEAEIEVLRNGRAKRATSIVPTFFAGKQLAGPGPYYRFDLEEAREKIKIAKQQLGKANLLDENGEIPEIRFSLTSGTMQSRIAAFARQQFKQIGVNIKPEFMDWPTLQHKVHTKQAQMYPMGWHADYYESENFLQLFYSPNIKEGTNNSNYSNSEFDKLYEQTRTMGDTPQRTKIYAQMIRMVNNDAPVLMLTEPLSVALYYNWYQNILAHPIGYGFGKFRRIDAKLRKKMGGRE